MPEKRKRTHPSYRAGVTWIAHNDEPGNDVVDETAAFISTLLLADLFGKDPHTVANDIMRVRLNDNLITSYHP